MNDSGAGVNARECTAFESTFGDRVVRVSFAVTGDEIRVTIAFDAETTHSEAQ